MDVAGGDAELLEECQNGNRQSFEELVRRTARYLYAHVYLQTGNAELTQDLVQETYLIAWRQIGQVKQSDALRAWLATIANRAVINQRRHAGRKKRFFVRQSLDDAQPAAASPTPVVDAQNSEERQQALDSLRSLPETYRVPLMLRYLQGADYEAIGKQLGLSNGSLRGLLHRGLAMLREKLNPPDEAESVAPSQRDDEEPK